MKDWTILIYANGNNEMEPEMYESMISCEKIGSNDNVDIIVQLARADRQIAQIMRPNKKLPKEVDKWTGVKRYYISKSNSKLVDNLGKVNMAHPNSLYEFIKWGIENYPATHYMIILSGHGISFVGNMTDLTYDVPYIMGTPEMCKAIELIHKNIGIEIDILVLDMCYMNSIEIIYEFGKNENNGVRNILTYIGEGPFEGLSYDTLISIVQKNSKFHDEIKILKEIIDNLNLDTIAFEVNHNKLENIKNKFNELAYCYLNNNDKNKIHTFDLLTKNDSIYPWHNILEELKQTLTSIIIYHKEVTNKEKSLIKVIFENIGYLIKLYYKLAFAKDNYWTKLLCDKKIYNKLTPYAQVDFKPMKLSKESILYSILANNPNISNEEAKLILNKMLSYKK